MKFTAWFSIVVGTLMIAQWGFFLAAGLVPEVQTEPIRLAFHLSAEGVTALALLISGAGLFGGRNWARTCSPVAIGMLLYTVIVSPGYFAQYGQWPLVGIFAVLLILALACLLAMIQERGAAAIQGSNR